MSLLYGDFFDDPIAPKGFTVPQRVDLKWIAVDLDGTLAAPLWTPENPTTAIGDPIKVNVTKVRELARKGFKIVIHTSRPWTDYEAIEEWCRLNDIPARRIQCGKILAAAYVDDRAIHADDSSWLPKAKDAYSPSTD